MLKSIKYQAIALCFLAVAAWQPAAADDGWFIGGAIGNGNIDDDIDGFSFDTDSTAYRFYAGYQFNEYFAVDAGYSDLGSFDEFIVQNMMPIPVSADADGFLFNATGIIPLNATFSLYGQLGVFFWDGKAAVGAINSNVSDTNLRIAAGVEARVYKRFSINADWARYDLDGTDADVLELGFRVGL